VLTINGCVLANNSSYYGGAVVSRLRPKLSRGGSPYFSLEFCNGGTLTEQLKNKPTSPREAAELIETLARAMHYAHLLGVVHLELKPGNVLLASPVAAAPGWTTRGADATPLPEISNFGLAAVSMLPTSSTA
jgi:serine/threonine protein kinase